MRRLQLRLLVFAAVMLVLSALLLSWLALRNFRHDLTPEMARTVSAVGFSAAAVLETAVHHGVPFESMVAVDELLAAARDDNPSIAYMVVTDNAGRLLYKSGRIDAAAQAGLDGPPGQVGDAPVTRVNGIYLDTALPLVFDGVRVGTLHLGQAGAIVAQRIREVAYDILTVLLVASLIALELLRFVLAVTVAAPFETAREFFARVRAGDLSHYLPDGHAGGLGGDCNAVIAALHARCHRFAARADAPMRAAMARALGAFRFHAPGERKHIVINTVDYIRWPFFLLIFADSLSLSFFPVYVEQFYSPAIGLSKNLVVGLPISVFMFTWALSMPWAGAWSDRVGHRKAFAVGAAVTTAGLLLTAVAHSLVDLLLWRSLTALGYGLVFITAQSYVSNNTPPERRTKGMAVFLSSFFAGSLAGSAIGGILADRLGFSPTILLSGVLSAVSALFVLRYIRECVGAPAPKRAISVDDFKRLLQHKNFMAITFLSAIPAKIALTGFLYYSVPLYLKLMGNNQSITGRVMMAYGLTIIMLSPYIASLADRFGKLRWFVCVGGYAAAFAMFVIYYFDNLFGLLASIFLLGIAHAVGVSPQLALINDCCRDVVRDIGSGTTNGIFRLIERTGNVLGPIIAGLLISSFGFKAAFLGFGVLILICISCFTVLFFGGGPAPRPASAEV